MTLATPVAARPRTVNTLPPADTFADLPVDTIPGDVTAMPPTPQAFMRGPGGATMMESRARGVTPRFSDDPLTSLPARIQYEQANPAADTNGRGRSFLSMLLRALPASMGQSQQLSAQRGTAYGPGDFFAGLAGGLGAGAAGAINPALDERARQQELVKRLQGQYGQAVQHRRVTSDMQERQLGNEYRRAQIADVVDRPVRARASMASRQAGVVARESRLSRATKLREVQAILKLHPHPFDPNNPDDAAILAKANEAGIVFDAEAWGRDTKNPYLVDVIDPDDESGTRRTKLSYNRQSGTWEKLEVGGRGLTSGYVQPVRERTGMTPAQEDAARARDRAEEGRNTRAARGSGSGGSRGTGGADQYRAAGIEIQKLLALKERIRREENYGDEKSKANAAQMGRELKVLGENLRARFPEMLDDDADGWPTKIRPRGVISRENLRRRAAELNISEAEAEREARADGLSVR